MHIYIQILLINFIILLVLHLYIGKLSEIFLLYDYPSERKIHKKKTPLIGGIIIIFFFFTNLFFFEGYLQKEFFFEYLNLENLKSYFFFLFLLFLFFLIGLYDDKYNLKNNIRLIWIIFLSYLLIHNNQGLNVTILKFSFNDGFSIDKYSSVFTIICLVSLIIFMNLYDGMNMQSGLFYIINFILIFIISGNIFFLYLFILPLIYFLFFNYNGRCFLGDSGSNLLACLFGIILIRLYINDETIFADHIFLILFIPFVDAARIFVSRILKGRQPFTPDKNHIHHILIKLFGEKRSIIYLSLFPTISSIFIYFKLSFFIGILLKLILYLYFLKKN